jgi:hypothetical protein
VQNRREEVRDADKKHSTHWEGTIPNVMIEVGRQLQCCSSIKSITVTVEPKREKVNPMEMFGDLREAFPYRIDIWRKK